MGSKKKSIVKISIVVEKAERDWSQQKEGTESLGKGSESSDPLFLLPHLLMADGFSLVLNKIIGFIIPLLRHFTI